MARMVTCKDCRGAVSSSAKQCPQCGRPIPHTSVVTWGCLGLLVFGLVGVLPAVCSGVTSNPPATRQPLAAAPPVAVPPGRIVDAGMSADEKAAFLKTRAGRLWKKHEGGWSPDDCRTIVDGKIRVGMTREMVRAAWGSPEHVNTTVYKSGVHEQWVYGSGQYVYFENGEMTSLQQSR